MSERVEQLLQAGNEASGRVRNLWITFLLFGTYLAIAIGGTTHRQMLLEAPIVLPILGAELPLVHFYQVAPILFLIFHFYLLVQLYLLAQKLHLLEGGITGPAVPKGAQGDLRARTDNFLITQLLVGKTGGVLPRLFIRVAAWLTMIFAPVLLLLAFQIRFLPYHDVFTTWLHRGTLIADVLIVWLLWPVITHPGGRLGGAFTAVFVERPLMFLSLRYEWQRQWREAMAAGEPGRAFGSVWRSMRAGVRPLFRFVKDLVASLILLAGSFAVIGFSVLVATIPAEELERWLLDHPLKTELQGEEIPEQWWIPSPRFAVISDNDMAWCLNRPRQLRTENDAEVWDKASGWGWAWWWPGTLGQRAGQGSNCDTGTVGLGYLVFDLSGPSISLHGYGYELAFDDESSTVIDLSVSAYGPWFSKRQRARPVPVETEPNHVWWPTAILFEGEPDQASSKVTSLFSRNLVLIDDIDLVTLNDDELAKVDRTLVLRGRDLRFARFDRADLRKADFFEANLSGATLSESRLQQAHFFEAEIQGTDLTLAEMQGANLRQAEMQGADLNSAQMQGADLFWTRLQGADLLGAGLQGANLVAAELQGAILSAAGLQGANLSGTRLQGADLISAQMQGANLSHAGLQGANLREAGLQGANLSWAKLQGADLTEAGLRGADLRWAGTWMTILKWANLEDAETVGANFADPFADTDPAARAEKAERAISGWLADIPAGEARHWAEVRLTSLRDHSRAPSWWWPWAHTRNLTLPESWTATEERALGAYLARLGCVSGTSPYIAQGLLRRMDNERNPLFRDEKRPYHPILAAALLAQDCTGAKGLTEEELVQLRAIRDGKE